MIDVTMSTYLAYSCFNNTRNCVTESFFMVLQPLHETKKERQTKWLYNVGKGLGITTFQFGKSKESCGHHFHQLRFAVDFVRRLLHKLLDL